MSNCLEGVGLAIKNFRHKGLKRFYQNGDCSLIRSDLRDKVEIVLSLLDTAESPEELRTYHYRLHKLKGDRKNYWAVTVKSNWRIVFRFENKNVYDVEMIDYH